MLHTNIHQKCMCLDPPKTYTLLYADADTAITERYKNEVHGIFINKSAFINKNAMNLMWDFSEGIQISSLCMKTQGQPEHKLSMIFLGERLFTIGIGHQDFLPHVVINNLIYSNVKAHCETCIVVRGSHIPY